MQSQAAVGDGVPEPSGKRFDFYGKSNFDGFAVKATLGRRESHAQGENVRPQKEAILDELRTDKTHPLQDAVIA